MTDLIASLALLVHDRTHAVTEGGQRIQHILARQVFAPHDFLQVKPSIHVRQHLGEIRMQRVCFVRRGGSGAR